MAAQYGSPPPVTYVQGAPAGPVTYVGADGQVYQAYVQPGVYAGGQPQQVVVMQPQPVVVDTVVVDDGGLWCCTLVGLLFSWVPIVGWITCCIGCMAPRGSRARCHGIAAGIIATCCFVIALAIGLTQGGTYYYY